MGKKPVETEPQNFALRLMPNVERGSDEAAEWLMGVHKGDTATNARLAAAAALDTERKWVNNDGYRLSDRLWNQKKTTRAAIDNTIRAAITKGADADSVAELLERYLHPDLRPARDLKGKIIPGQPKYIVTEKPDTMGKGSYPARRLARTEITRSHGAGVMGASQTNPFVIGIKWSLSGSHPKTDECNIQAEHVEAPFGVRGVFPKGGVPRYPSHPMCLCFLSPFVDPKANATIVADLRAKYGLDAPALPGGDEGDPFALPWVKHSTIEAARAYAESMGLTITGGVADAPDIELNMLNVITSGHHRLGTLGIDGVRGTNVLIDDFSERLRTTDAVGFVNRDDPTFTVRMNSSFRSLWADPEANIKVLQQPPIGFVGSDVESIYIHEFGHSANFRLYAEAGEEIPFGSAARFDPEERLQIATEVSKYASVNVQEFVAEVFAGQTEGHIYSEEIMSRYRSLHGPTVPQLAARAEVLAPTAAQEAATEAHLRRFIRRIDKAKVSANLEEIVSLQDAVEAGRITANEAINVVSKITGEAVPADLFEQVASAEAQRAAEREAIDQAARQVAAENAAAAEQIRALAEVQDLEALHADLFDYYAATNDAEKRAKILDFYSGGGGYRQNAALRHGTSTEIKQRVGAFLDTIETASQQELDQFVKAFDSALQRQVTDREMVLYRGAPDDDLYHRMRNARPGDVISDPAYASTTIDRSVSEGFGGVRGDGSRADNSTLFVIRAPKGSPGTYIGGRYQYPGQQEFIMNRDSKLVIREVAQDPKGGITVYADYVPDPDVVNSVVEREARLAAKKAEQAP